MRLSELQTEHRKWLDHNFPGQQSHSALLGIVEEVGELAHAHLKQEQGIRGQQGEAIVDALGDIVIYMLSYCNTNHLDLQHCVERAWREVKERDWIEFPGTGRPAQ